MASGIARGRVRTTTTATESRNMVAILQIIGWHRCAPFLYRELLWYWTSMLWSIDICQNKVSADQYQVTISRAQVYSSSRSRVFLKLTADQVLIFDWIAGSCQVNLLNFISFCPRTIPSCTCLTGLLSFPSTPDRMHSQVRTWTKNVDIFEKDFVIVPINERYVIQSWSEYYTERVWWVSMITNLAWASRPTLVTAYICASLILDSMLWSNNTCQNKVSADQHHVAISRAQVYSSSKSRVF